MTILVVLIVVTLVLAVLLARRLNRLAQHVRDLEASRNDLSRAMDRIGDALADTHHRDTILDVVLEMSALVTRGQMSVLWCPHDDGSYVARMVHNETALDFPAHQPADGRPARAQVGDGLVGWVASRREPRWVDRADQLAGVEPRATCGLAMPIHSSGKLFGVLAVYGRDAGDPGQGGRGARAGFAESEIMGLVTLTVQAEAAIENILLHEEASRLAVTDGLTGLWNRRYFDRRSEEEAERWVRFGEPFGVVIVDIDNFKLVNDTYGHPVGDAVLVEVGQRLVSSTREVDLVVRYGGEEFALLLPRTDLESAEVLAEKLRAAIAGEPVRSGDLEIPITISLGVAALPESAPTIRGLVHAADQALYRAKADGKDRVESAYPDGPTSESETTS